MGFYDRDYYREATRHSGFLSGTAPACKAIITVNVAVFLGQWLFQRAIPWDQLMASSSDIFEKGHVWQLLTAPFLHSTANKFHIVWNMLFLWFVGRDMEAMYGRREFTAMYLAAAVFSTFCWAVVDYFVQGRGSGSMLGASGAVMGVVVLYALYYPRRELLLFGLVPIEMWLLVVIYQGCDLLSLLQEMDGSAGFGHGVALASHLGGGAYGYLYKRFDLRWSRLLASAPRQPRLRLIVPEPRERVAPLPSNQAHTASTAPPRPNPSGFSFPEEQLDARLDEVLVKIASQGREGLTDEEQRILQEASRRARNRRTDRT